jgi:hypothetical protein
MQGISMANKKNNKNIAKRQAKAGQNKARKRKLRLVKTKKQQQHRPDYDYAYPPLDFGPAPMADVEAPAGLRTVGMSGALMEFAKALLKHSDLKGGGMQDAFNLAMPLWNYAIAMEQGETDSRLRDEVVKGVMSACKVDMEAARETVDKAVARKNEMFPPEVQPRGTAYMFMRKEVLHLITPFNYDRLSVIDQAVPATEQDHRFFEQLAALDEVKKHADDYEEWEKQYEIVRENFGEVFWGWLVAKGVGEKMAEDFTFKAEFFINFIYYYGCTDILRNTDYGCFDEFFFDFVLRKIMLGEPGEHVEWVPALRLFFAFLAEKGYVDDAAPYVEAIDRFEEPFLGLLRKKYG